MSQPTHLTLALGRAGCHRTEKNTGNEKDRQAPDLSLTVSYRLDPGETDLKAVVEARADELRDAFLLLYARLGVPDGPCPLPDTGPEGEADDEEPLEEWQDEDAPDEDDTEDDRDALAGEDDVDADEDEEPDDRPPTFPNTARPSAGPNGHGGVHSPATPALTPAPSPPAEPSSRVQQIAARSAAWRAGLSGDDLTLLLAQHFGKVRVEQLDKHEAETFLKALQREEVTARTAALH